MRVRERERERCYFRSMADNSFSWAAERGLTRVNEVHKMEEAKLVLEEFFENETEQGTSREMSGSATVEDCLDPEI